jgi:hypothetical protein
VSLAVTYFRTGNPHYHRRGVVSRSCSGWEGVGPTRYGHQAIRGSPFGGSLCVRPRGAMHSEEVRGIGGVKDCSRPMTLMFGVIGSSRTGN